MKTENSTEDWTRRVGGVKAIRAQRSKWTYSKQAESSRESFSIHYIVKAVRTVSPRDRNARYARGRNASCIASRNFPTTVYVHSSPCRPRAPSDSNSMETDSARKPPTAGRAVTSTTNRLYRHGYSTSNESADVAAPHSVYTRVDRASVCTRARRKRGRHVVKHSGFAGVRDVHWCHPNNH